MKFNNSLVDLDLDENPISSFGMRDIANALELNESLQELSLGGNMHVIDIQIVKKLKENVTRLNFYEENLEYAY